MVKKEKRLTLLPQNTAQVRTLYLQKPRDFEGLISGYTNIRAISYVASPSFVLSIFEKYGFKSMQLLVGENISINHYKKDLENKQIDLIQKMMHLVRDQKLIVYFPKNKTIHSKFYILSRGDDHRVIVGSANFSETARKALKQHNYVVYWDLKTKDSLLETFNQDFEAHLKNSVLFLDDLIKLVDNRDEPEEAIIRTWISQDVGEIKDIIESEASRVFTDLTRQALKSIEENDAKDQEEIPGGDHEKGEIRVIIPSDIRTREGVEKKLQPLNPSVVDSQLRLRADVFSDYVRKTCGVPLMGVEKKFRKVYLHMGSHQDILSLPPEKRAEVGPGLEYIEKYIESYRLGECLDYNKIQMNVFEALLYVLSAPFAHEFKTLKKQVDMYSRGPGYLYLYGPSFNGKTNFLRFCLKLITGQNTEPISQEYFNKSGIMGARTFCTVFPLMFDDVNIGSNPTMEKVLKNYWEVWWTQDHPCPQIIMTTNKPNPPEWAKTRIKRINFDVKFDQKNILACETLNQILNTRCDFFKFFAWKYLDKMNEPIDSIKQHLLVDELSLARIVFKELYDLSGRPVPDYFPAIPADSVYDTDKMEWLELFEAGVLSQEQQANKVMVQADKNLATYEVEKFLACLPQGVKAKRSGHAIIIEGKDKYLEWLDQTKKKRGFWQNIMSKFTHPRSARFD
jgi:hypothetical protein